MFKASDIIIAAFTRQLRQSYALAFGDGVPGHADIIADAASGALNRIARSNALYHDIDHTVTVTLVGQEILRGRMIRDADVTSRDWVHFLVSLLYFSIGFVQGICPGDTPDRVVVGENGATLPMPPGATDSSLWPYFADRGKLFVRLRYQGHPVIDPEELAGNIEFARFPPPPDRNLETDSYPGLLRAAHMIGAVADPNFMIKMKPLFLELQSCGLHELLGYGDVAALRAGYTELFWSVIHPYTKHGVSLLQFTGDGRQWLANMHAHLLAEEHHIPARGAARAVAE